MKEGAQPVQGGCTAGAAAPQLLMGVHPHSPATWPACHWRWSKLHGVPLPHVNKQASRRAAAPCPTLPVHALLAALLPSL